MKNVRKHRISTGILVLCIGIVLTAVGISLKQDQDVWRKAILMCLECIGLG